MKITVNEKSLKKIALTIIIVSFLISLITPFFIIVAIPMYIIGSIILGASTNLTFRNKLGLFFIPILLYVPVYIVSMKLLVFIIAEPETYWIQERYIGPITIIYGEENGVNTAFDENRTLYKIPDSGVLITNKPYKGGFIDHYFFYVNETNITKELFYLDFLNSYDNVDTSQYTIGILHPVSGSGQFGVKTKSYKFQRFFVGSYNDLEKYTLIQNGQHDSIIKAELYNIRSYKK